MKGVKEREKGKGKREMTCWAVLEVQIVAECAWASRHG